MAMKYDELLELVLENAAEVKDIRKRIRTNLHNADSAISKKEYKSALEFLYDAKSDFNEMTQEIQRMVEGGTLKDVKQLKKLVVYTKFLGIVARWIGGLNLSKAVQPALYPYMDALVANNKMPGKKEVKASLRMTDKKSLVVGTGAMAASIALDKSYMKEIKFTCNLLQRKIDSKIAEVKQRLNESER